MKKEGAKKLVTKEDLPPINMVYVKGGCYEMGDFEGNGDDERPVHEVCVTDFYIDVQESQGHGDIRQLVSRQPVHTEAQH